MTKDKSTEWRQFLGRYVEERPIAIVKLADDEFASLLSSKKGMTEFSLNIPHDLLREVVAPCVCLITGTRAKGFNELDSDEEIAYVGVIKSKSVRSTLDTTIKIERTARVMPAASALAPLIADARFSQLFTDRLSDDAPVIRLSPKLSAAIVGTLANNDRNHGPLRVVAAGLQRPSPESVARQQTDAIDMALKVFGLSSDAAAAKLDLVGGKDTRLVSARIMEDAVIEHDARSVPEFDLVGSDATGRAMFRKGDQTLEVITANRNKLEKAFGVDLIYLNHFHNNLVMVQYKMLAPDDSSSGLDWVYTQDRHLEKQLRAMDWFAPHSRRAGPYRLSSEFVYFKFVRRYGTATNSSMLMPLEHLKEVIADPRHQAGSGKLRLSYQSLDGKYMRQTAFYSLLQSGYIGADVVTTGALQTLITDLLAGGDALVLAIQRETTTEEEASDRERRVRLWDEPDAGMH